MEENPFEKHDPLFDLKKLNEELEKEIGTDLVEDLPIPVGQKTVILNDIPPLIEVDEDIEE